MALPADFSKIFGSTATGGLTPISDVNYAKGWEFVGSNPPTKNDFSYLQNLSDLKSQWLYSNKLQRANPFGDIKSDGAVETALGNLGLGGAAKLDAASASFGGNGWLRLPVLLGDDKKTLIIQWAYGTAGSSSSTGLVCNFPFTFPNKVFAVMTGNIDQTYTSTATPGSIGFCNVTRSSITAKGTLSTSEQFYYLAIGY